MKHIRQPEGSSLCGQCCVAMAAGVSLDRSIEVIGHSKGTWTPEIVRALRKFGVVCEEKCRRVSLKSSIPERAMLSIKVAGSKGGIHWALVWDGLFYDPGRPEPSLTPLLSYPPNSRIVSFLEIHS